MATESTITKAISAAIQGGQVLPPADTITAVARGTANTLQRSAVQAWLNTAAPGWRSVMTQEKAAGWMGVAALVGVGTTVVNQARGNISDIDVGIANALGIKPAAVAAYEEQEVVQTKFLPSLKMTGIGYFFKYFPEVEADPGNNVVYEPEHWKVSYRAPDVDAMMGSSDIGGLGIVLGSLPHVTGRDGAKFFESVSNGLPFHFEDGETDEQPSVSTFGLFLFTHRMRHAGRITTLQVQVPPEYYSEVASGTAQVWVDGDLVYQDADGVDLARALQGDATPASLALDIVVEAHSKVEVILELGAEIVIGREDTYLPPITGALTLQRV